MVITSLHVGITSLSVHRTTASAKTTYTIIGTYAADKSPPKPLRGVMHLSDDWTLVAGRWKLRSITVRDVVSVVDGKVVQSERARMPPSRAAIAELRRRAVVIPTLALNADPDQFAAIGNAIGNARIVGMGEGTHGTSEFFAFKNRLFKYLVDRKGFTVFAMEAAWGAGLNVDRYIKTGRGTAQQAVASLTFLVWNTPQVVDLIQWMRDYNAAPGKHPILSFVGIDMQDPMGAIGYLAGYLHAHDPTEPGSGKPSTSMQRRCNGPLRRKTAAGLSLEGCSRRSSIGDVRDAPDVATAQEAVTNILQFLDFAGQTNNAQVGMRDRDMASNVEWLAAQYPDAKIALWAHNGHVGTTPELSYRPMGSYLRQALGPAYYVIGQTFGSGTVRAVVSGHGLQSVRVPLNPGDTMVEPVRASQCRGVPRSSRITGRRCAPQFLLDATWNQRNRLRNGSVAR